MKTNRSVLWMTAVVGCLSLILAGCVPSVNPFYTEETTVERDEIVGRWVSTTDDKDAWVFTKKEAKSYSLTIEEEENKKSPFQVKLVKLGEHYFLDLYPDGGVLDKDKLGGFYSASIIPGHLVIRVKFGQTLELGMMDPDWLKKVLEQDPKALAHAYPEKEHLVITASTKELQAFVLKHIKTEGAWGEPGQYKKAK